ncbi:hypothetical protein XMG59_002074 [Marinobacterium sp. xm-g-59]|uniref:hypothetical protein n=1 Tax=Marinobacterium sp. xm-g-59 TaxID=2497748 RepID=UPI00156861AB|nr:hypothetical protein [Marinobacterium sp. xm-g-59]NRP95956.1 hypothetical protein [Marinobacterium sp. xm-g-59]
MLPTVDLSPKKRIEAELYLEDRECRKNSINYRKKSKDDMFFELLDRLDKCFYDDYTMKIIVVVDAKFDIAELEFSGSTYGFRTFKGSTEQVRSLLGFIALLVNYDLEKGDKLTLSYSDQNVYLEREIAEFDDQADYAGDPTGWQPDSPEECSDTEREVFFPKD